MTREDINKARQVLAMWLNNKVKRHNQDKWLKLIERHLAKLSGCVRDGVRHRPMEKHIVTGHWND